MTNKNSISTGLDISEADYVKIEAVFSELANGVFERSSLDESKIQVELSFPVLSIIPALNLLASDYDLKWNFSASSTSQSIDIKIPLGAEVAEVAKGLLQKKVESSANSGNYIPRRSTLTEYEKMACWKKYKIPKARIRGYSDIAKMLAQNCVNLNMCQLPSEDGCFIVYEIASKMDPEEAAAALQSELKKQDMDGELFCRAKDGFLFIGARDEDSLHSNLMILAGYKSKASAGKAR